MLGADEWTTSRCWAKFASCWKLRIVAECFSTSATRSARNDPQDPIDVNHCEAQVLSDLGLCHRQVVCPR
jgi:hypothetical protein